MVTQRGRVTLFAVVILVAACRSSDPQKEWKYWEPKVIAAAETNPPVVIEPGKSVAGVAIGMTKPEVEQVLGKPQRRRSSDQWEYLTLGMAVSFRDGRAHTIWAGSGSCGDPGRLLAKVFKGRIDGSVGMGTTKAEVVEVLGEPSTIREMSDLMEEVWFRQNGIVFMFERGQVMWLAVFRPAR